MERFRQFSVALLMISFLSQGVLSEELNGGDRLAEGFAAPPAEAGPMTWWHWIDGNVSSEGISKDLEAMKAANIRAAILFNVGYKYPAGPAEFMEPVWQANVQHAVREAARLDMKLGAFNSPGYSQSGGPWISAEQSMKCLVFSRVDVPAGFSGPITLPRPEIERNLYRDIAVIAYPARREAALLKNWQVKSGREIIRRDEYSADTFSFSGDSDDDSGILRSEQVLVLHDSLSADRLNWTPPSSGEWTVLRVGYTSTGVSVHPATPKSAGSECDKLNPEIVRYHLESYVGRLKAICDQAVPGVFKYVQSESWECETQDWTDGIEQDFMGSVGLDILPYFPLLLTGQIIGSVEESERVLWDWRNYLSGRIATAYYGEMHRFCRENGLMLIGENAGRQQYLNSGAHFMRFCDIPMGETHAGGPARADNRAAASSVHITGSRPFVASETFTSAATFRHHPATLQPVLDRSFCEGVNLAIFHTYVHQPWDQAPGLTMGPWGSCLNRLNTWYTKADGWFDYIHRCQFMLQQGQTVADLLVFSGEGAPVYLGFRNEQVAPVPPGLDFDGCDWVSLRNAQVEDGLIVMENGRRYSVLVLSGQNRMSLPVLRKVDEFVRQGAVVAGVKPIGSPGWANRQDDAKIRQLAQVLWGEFEGERLFGAESLERVLQRAGLAQDFVSPSELGYTHRRTDEADIYFVFNNRRHPITEKVLFRGASRQPELWDPVSGRIRLEAGEQLEGTVRVPLSLEANETVFVVFRRDRTEGLESAAGGELISTVQLDGSWEVSFPPESGVPTMVRMEQLIPLNEHPEPLVRYFSGTAVYRKNFLLPDSLPPGRIELDLGRVEILAKVRLNGKSAGSVWRRPFRIDVSALAVPGENNLEIHVTGLWVNRMIGDEHLPQDVEWRAPLWKRTQLAKWPGWLNGEVERVSGRKAFCSIKLFREEDQLVPSGLIGPVTLRMFPE